MRKSIYFHVPSGPESGTCLGISAGCEDDFGGSQDTKGSQLGISFSSTSERPHL